ncbi:hypothetical protein FBU30_003395 [Linnemannia zychae]|nr:hypothetical protein FBU30_003395 [Linnemannia zychae]
MPNSQLQEVYRQGLGGMDAWTRHRHFIENYVKFYNTQPPKQETPTVTERDILVENHRFLRSETDDQDLTWEKRIAKKYYDKLFKEYALVELKYFKEGRIAMRWRNQNEVIRGKGQFTCGNLKCDESKGLESWEVNFGYVEQGEKKNALVKVRLCERCSYKLNYKSTHKRADQDQVKESTSTSTISDRTSKRRSRSHSTERDAESRKTESSRRSHHIRDHRESSKRRKSSHHDTDKIDDRDLTKQSDQRSDRSISDSHDRQRKSDDRLGRTRKNYDDEKSSNRSERDDRRGANYESAQEATNMNNSKTEVEIDKGTKGHSDNRKQDKSNEASSMEEFDRFFKGLFE